jgi:hypothetical protein
MAYMWQNQWQIDHLANQSPRILD